jgi:hypothetical protein
MTLTNETWCVSVNNKLSARVRSSEFSAATFACLYEEVGFSPSFSAATDVVDVGYSQCYLSIFCVEQDTT